MSETQLRTAYLTGPAEYQSALFGSGAQKRQRIIYGAAVAFTVIAMLNDPIGGALIGAVVGLVAVVLVSPTVTGDLLGKLTARYRWHQRVKRGVNAYEPYDDAAVQALAQSGARGWTRRAAAHRQMPDGCAGMGWLQSGVGEIGIAWHQPLDGTTPYLSVAYEVDGRMRGFESIESLNRSTDAWAGFLASLGGDFSLCRYVQVLTRILPPATALHERWAAEHVDESLRSRGDFGTSLLASYEEVIRTAGAIGTVQRHFVIVRYDLTADFLTRAKRLGAGVLGWRQLMASEVASMTRSLKAAGVGRVRPLTARQVAAFIRHAQSPSVELDRVSDIDVANFGVPSRDTRAVYRTEDMALANEGTYWYTATARVEAPNVDAGLKGMFWVNGWLVNMPEVIVRSMSFHIRVVPARTARTLAREDETSHASEVGRLRRNGSVARDESEARLHAAQARAEDLRPGSGHHGIEWMGFVTVSSASQEELETHTRMIAERASTELGVRRLEWCRDIQSIAAGYTWPIARALAPHGRRSIGAVMEGAISRIDTEGDFS